MEHAATPTAISNFGTTGLWQYVLDASSLSEFHTRIAAACDTLFTRYRNPVAGKRFRQHCLQSKAQWKAVKDFKAAVQRAQALQRAADSVYRDAQQRFTAHPDMKSSVRSTILRSVGIAINKAKLASETAEHRRQDVRFYLLETSS